MVLFNLSVGEEIKFGTDVIKGEYEESQIIENDFELIGFAIEKFLINKNRKGDYAVLVDRDIRLLGQYFFGKVLRHFMILVAKMNLSDSLNRDLVYLHLMACCYQK